MHIKIKRKKGGVCELCGHKVKSGGNRHAKGKCPTPPEKLAEAKAYKKSLKAAVARRKGQENDPLNVKRGIAVPQLNRNTGSKENSKKKGDPKK